MLVDIDEFPVLKIISDVADSSGVNAWVVGGFVRDVLLKRHNDDIDIVCLGDCVSFAHDVASRLGVQWVTTYKRYRTAMISYKDIQLEFVGARKESYTGDSRNPVVCEGTFDDDQRRRDFTINTLAIGLNKHNLGELVDNMGGAFDLEKGIIRTPVDPSITFHDDPLRMMRAIRFACQLNFKIYDDTLNAICQQADRISIICQERITTEINKILLSEKPSIGFYLLSQTGLLKIIMPYLEDLKTDNNRQQFSHKDIFSHTLQVVDNVSRNSTNLWLRWTALLHDIAKPKTKRFDPSVGFTFHGHDELGARMVKDIFIKLKLPMSEVDYVSKLIRLHLRPIAIARDDVSDSGIRRLSYEAGDDIDDLMILCRADITSHNDSKVKQYLDNFARVEQKLAYVKKKDHIKNLQPVITGKIIMDELGLQPGPIVGRIKSELKEAILDERVQNDYDSLHEFMMSVIDTLGINKK